MKSVRGCTEYVNMDYPSVWVWLEAQTASYLTSSRPMMRNVKRGPRAVCCDNGTEPVGFIKEPEFSCLSDISRTPPLQSVMKVNPDCKLFCFSVYGPNLKQFGAERRAGLPHDK
jgi:hypothetical protein